MNSSNRNKIDELLNEIEKGKQSGEQQGWLSESDIKEHFYKRYTEIEKSTC